MADARECRRYQAMTWLAGWLLVRSAKLALRMGDRREFEAIHAAIRAGNTGSRKVA